MIRLDYRDARPIYEQVKDGLRRLMVTGMLAPGEKLPSVRSLAMDLAINPNTIQRAYAQLEMEATSTPWQAGVPSWRRGRSRIWSAPGGGGQGAADWYRSCGSWV